MSHEAAANGALDPGCGARPNGIIAVAAVGADSVGGPVGPTAPALAADGPAPRGETFGGAPPPRCPAKMLYKKFPGMQAHQAVPPTPIKREHEPNAEAFEPPLKRAAVPGSSNECQPASVGCSPRSSAHNASSSHAEIDALQRRVKELETELYYTREDLLHEQARWSHFRRCAQRLNIWGVLMGVADLQGSEVIPLRNASHSEALLESEVQLGELQQALEEEKAQSEAAQKETERLSHEAQELRRQLLLHAAQDGLGSEKVAEHPLYRKVLGCYHHEHQLGKRYSQRLESLKSELVQEGQRCRLVQETTEEQEKRRRKKLEQMLHDRDHRLIEKDAANKDLSYRLKKLEAIAEQASYEQQKAKEYMVLASSMKKEMEKLRQRLERQRQGGRAEDLATEVESVTKAYEGLLERNGGLLEQLGEKDRLTSSLLSERLKNQHSISLLKTELENVTHSVEANEKLRANQEAWILKMQDVLQTLQSEEKQLSRQCRDLQALNIEQERELVALRLEVKELRHEAARQREASQQFAGQAEELTRQSSEATDLSRRRGEELLRLQSKYEWLKKKATDPAPKTNASPEGQEVAELREQVLALRAVLNCNVCGQRRKNTILTRCLHIFCAECVEDNLRDRKRKCPQCATKFSDADVKPVFLCEK